MKQWRLLARHKHLLKITISEFCLIDNDLIRNYTATICGWSGWQLGDDWDHAQEHAKQIRDRIEGKDETVFKKGINL